MKVLFLSHDFRIRKLSQKCQENLLKFPDHFFPALQVGGLGTRLIHEWRTLTHMHNHARAVPSKGFYVDRMEKSAVDPILVEKSDIVLTDISNKLILER